MIMNFKKVIEKATQINSKHVNAIKLVIRPRIFRIIYVDDRTRGFDNVKPFAADDEAYYVCCPCCLQIERIKASEFKGRSKAKIQCTSKKNSQRFMIDQDTSSEIGFKMTGYTVDLNGWENKNERWVNDAKNKAHKASKTQDIIEKSC